MDALRRWTSLLALMLCACDQPANLTSASPDPIEKEAPAAALKVAFVYVSPVGDGGWVYAHDIARRAVDIEFGTSVVTRAIENVREGPEAEQVFRRLAADGYKLIFGASVGYTEAMLRVAADFPDVKFENVSGDKNAANVASFQARSYEGAYLAGVVAGRMTRTGTLGFVASIPVPEVIRNINAFALGARSVNPEVVTHVAWADTWYDLAKERAAAEELIGQRADVLIQNTNSSAVLKTAQEKDVMAFGWDSDMAQYGPRAHLGSAVIDWSTYYKQRVAAALRGEWQPGSVWLGVRDGAVRLASPNPNLPVDLMLLGERTRELREKKRHPFQGPLRDQSGVERVKADALMSDSELKKMDFFVEGVKSAREPHDGHFAH